MGLCLVVWFMGVWSWSSDSAGRLVDGYSSFMVVIVLFLILYMFFIFALLPYAERLGGSQLMGFLIEVSIFLVLFLSIAAVSYSRMSSLRRALSCLRGVEVGNRVLTLVTVNGTYRVGLDEVLICYRVLRFMRPGHYNVFIKYRGLVYEIPELRPEDFGALMQVLRDYGVEVNKCADDLSKYVCVGSK